MKKFVEAYSDRYEEYLRDESRYTGSCEEISFPDTVEAMAETARECLKQGRSVTVQGARTGLCGAGVPAGGHLLSTEKLERLVSVTEEDGRTLVCVEPGMRLSALAAELAARRSGAAFLPNPTETTATAGGAFACNAKGPNGLLYGSVGDRTAEAEILLADGTVMKLRRGEAVLRDGACTLPDGRELHVEGLPADAGGYSGLLSLHEGEDLLDVFAGSEGMLGIVLNLTLEAGKLPSEQWGIVFFFGEEGDPLGFAEAAAGAQEEFPGDTRLAVGEYFHETALSMVDSMRSTIQGLAALPDFPAGTRQAVYLEVCGESEDDVGEALMMLLELFTEFGGNEDDTWAGTGAAEMEKFRLLRHAAPEAANVRVSEARLACREITKLAADFTAPAECRRELVELYESGLAGAGLAGSIFGHVIENRIHVNVFAGDAQEYRAGRELLASWARAVAGMGGCVISENGVGKLKRELLRESVDPGRLERARAVKEFFDPKGLLNPGNLF